MDAFKGFVVKEFYHILRDYRSLLVLFGMPIIMLLLFGYAIRNEPNEAKVAILDLAKDETSQRIAKKLDITEELDVVMYLESRDQIDEVFKSGEVKEVVVFEPNLKQRWKSEGYAAIQVINDASDPNMAQLLSEYTRAVVLDFQKQELQSGDLPVNFNQAANIGLSARAMFNPQLESVFIFVPGLIAVILMLISSLMTSITVTREKEMGSMEVLLVSPLNSGQIILGKVLPYLLLSLVNVLTVLAMARWIYQVPFEGSFLLFMVEAFLFIFTALALGLLISTLSNNQQTAMMIALAGLLLPTILLSGFIFPISSMPEILQWISIAIPARWFLEIVRGIMLKGVDLAVLWQETLILAGMAAFFIIISTMRFQNRLEG